MLSSKFHKTGQIIFVIVFGMLLIACGSDTPASDQNAPGISVEINETNCPSIAVQVGDQAVWTNSGESDLVVYAESSDGEVIFDSGVLKPGDSYSITFSEAGNYDYRCTEDGPFSSTLTIE